MNEAIVQRQAVSLRNLENQMRQLATTFKNPTWAGPNSAPKELSKGEDCPALISD